MQWATAAVKVSSELALRVCVRDGTGRWWSGFWACRWGWTSGPL